MIPSTNFEFIMNKSDFLNTLHHYRDKLKDEHSSPGWNMWALFGALAALVWLLISLLKEGSITLEAGFAPLFMLILSIPLVQFGISAIKSKKINSSKNFYSSIKQEVTEDIFTTTYQFIVHALILIYCNRVLAISEPYSTTLNAYVGLQLIIVLVMFIASRSSYHAPDIENFQHPIIKWSKRVGMSLLWIACFVSICGLGLKINNWIDYSMYQSAFLLFGIYYTILRILGEIEGNPLLVSIDDLIDDVTFDKVKLDEAEKKLRLILFGSEFKDVIAPEIADFITSNDTYQALVIKTRERCDQYFRVSNELRQALEESIEVNLKEVLKVQDELNRKIKKVNQKMIGYWLFERESPDYKEIQDTFRSMIEQSSRLVEELKNFVAEMQKREEAEGNKSLDQKEKKRGMKRRKIGKVQRVPKKIHNQ